MQSTAFVQTTIANHDLVSVSASHELVEMLVDPAINLLSTGPDPKIIYGYESADPVEQLSYPVNGIAMTDLVYPSERAKRVLERAGPAAIARAAAPTCSRV